MTTQNDRRHFSTQLGALANIPTDLSRRTVLKSAASLALAASGAALGGSRAASAQVQGSMEGGGSVPLRLPLGAIDHLDRNQYIHNMEIHAHISGVTASGGEPLTTLVGQGRTAMPARRRRICGHQ